MPGGTATAAQGEPPQQHTAQAQAVHLVQEVAARSRTDSLRDLITEKFTGDNKPSATVRDFTLVANEPTNGADPENPFTETELQAVVVQLGEDGVIVEFDGWIFPFE